MQFQQRDTQILTAIYDYGGVLSRAQVKEMFWPDKSWRAMEVRLAKLYRTGYIAWPDGNHRKQNAIPRSILWLGPNGILHVARGRGVELDPPARITESALRKLEKVLRKESITWLREPAWSKLGHDLTLVDVRRAIERATGSVEHIRLGEWISEHTFRAKPDRIIYQVAKRGLVKTNTRAVIPDGCFTLIDINRAREGRPHKARFLVELDIATHSNPNFGRFKVAPYSAYVGSKAFIDRFGGRTARWLVITTGATRLRNLMAQSAKFAGTRASLFHFALTKDVLANNPLIEPIWRRPGQNSTVSLIGER